MKKGGLKGSSGEILSVGDSLGREYLQTHFDKVPTLTRSHTMQVAR